MTPGTRRILGASVKIACALAVVLLVSSLLTTRLRAGPGGFISIKSTPPGAEVYLDDEDMPRGTTPCIIQDVPRGRHVVRVRLFGYAEATSEVDVRPNGMSKVKVTR